MSVNTHPTIRMATAADATALAGLINRAFLVERSFVDGDRVSVDEVRDRLARGMFLVEEESTGALVACVYVEPHGARASIGMLAVDPARQRQGIGRRMMTAAEARCRDLGIGAIDIRIVNLRSELPSFYSSLGYVMTGEAPFDDVRAFRPAHFLLMSKALA